MNSKNYPSNFIVPHTTSRPAHSIASALLPLHRVLNVKPTAVASPPATPVLVARMISAPVSAETFSAALAAVPTPAMETTKLQVACAASASAPGPVTVYGSKKIASLPEVTHG